MSTGAEQHDTCCYISCKEIDCTATRPRYSWRPFGTRKRELNREGENTTEKTPRL